MEENKRKLLINIHDRLEHKIERDSAIQDLNLNTKVYEQWEDIDQI